MNAADTLMLFKTKDRREGAILVADDMAALKILNAWGSCPTTSALPEGDAPDDEARAWDWLWTEATPIGELAERLSERSGIDPPELVERKLVVLMTSRLIFPDGTISDWASKILAAKVAAEFKIRQKKRS